MIKKKKTIITIVGFALLDAIVIILVFFFFIRHPAYSVHVRIKPPLKIYTRQQLAAYNGDDPSKPIYIGLDGYVFDVSKSPGIYGLGGEYHKLAGTDTTSPLMEMFGAATVMRKYYAVGVLK